MNMYWISGLVRHRIVRLAGATFGVGITVALLACLGFFLANSSASMTQRAVSAVPIDWQVEAVPAADVNAIHDAIGTAPRQTRFMRWSTHRRQDWRQRQAQRFRPPGPERSSLSTRAI